MITFMHFASATKSQNSTFADSFYLLIRADYSVLLLALEVAVLSSSAEYSSIQSTAIKVPFYWT